MDYHSDRFIDFSLLVFKAENLVGVIPANKTATQLHSHLGLSYGGFVIDESLKLNAFIEAFKSVLKFLETQGVEQFNIKLLPPIYYKFPSDELKYVLFLAKAELRQRILTSVIDNNKPKINISNIRKRGLKKAEEHKLIVKEDSSFDAFWEYVLIPNLEQRFNKKPVHTLEEIKRLHSKFPNQIRQFNVYKNNVIVAGTTVFETETVAHAQYISATEERQELGSLDILFDKLINKTFNSKAFFDFGTSNENNGKNINEGLLYWKESFGARTVSQDFYTVKTTNHKLLDQVML